MTNLKEIAKRNGIAVRSRRYNLASLISESYQTLYKFKVDSPLYKMTEKLIEGIQEDPENIEAHSEDLETLKSLQSMGEEADVTEKDLEDFVEEEEELEEPPFVEEENEEEVPVEEIPDEDEEVVLNEEEPMEDEITPEELAELRNHLTEMRKTRKMHESSWNSERSNMSSALKNFRESSTKKAFYKSLGRLAPRLQSGSAPLTMQESISLYKSTNSAMTHLAVELEHNPGFIYTFRECTNILKNDNNALLECISNNKTPNKSLVESFRSFASILLESEEVPDEDYDDDMIDENQEQHLEKKDDADVINEDQEKHLEKKDDADVINEDQEKHLEKEDDADVINEDQEKHLEKKDDADLINEDQEKHLEKEDGADVIDEGDGVNLEKEDGEDLLEEEEIPAEEELPTPDDEEVPVEENDELEDEVITDEEAEELRNYLKEMRKNRCK